jgi:hypothetical protein
MCFCGVGKCACGVCVRKRTHTPHAGVMQSGLHGTSLRCKCLGWDGLCPAPVLRCCVRVRGWGRGQRTRQDGQGPPDDSAAFCAPHKPPRWCALVMAGLAGLIRMRGLRGAGFKCRLALEVKMAFNKPEKCAMFDVCVRAQREQELRLESPFACPTKSLSSLPSRPPQ